MLRPMKSRVAVLRQQSVVPFAAAFAVLGACAFTWYFFTIA